MIPPGGPELDLEPSEYLGIQDSEHQTQFSDFLLLLQRTSMLAFLATVADHDHAKLAAHHIIVYRLSTPRAEAQSQTFTLQVC